jgi:phage anti-repressor protein
MTQIIKPDSVDFNVLIKNSTVLTSNGQSKMIETLTTEFTKEESKWYIANLYIYMNYHPTNDFPINLDTLVNLVGFAHKKNAKRTLENNFTKDEDYKILLLPKEEQVKTNGGAGLNKEKVMLNIDTFKNMCMLVKTEKSKQIRKYYVKLENIYNKIIKEEIENKDKLLTEKETQLVNTKRELTKEKTLRNKMLNRRCFDAEEGEYVYIYQDILDDPNSLLKIGKSTKLINREEFYSNINKSGGIVFYIKCIDCSLIERVCHHILDKFRENKMQDESFRFDSSAWFKIDLELAKKTIKTVVTILDLQIDNIEIVIPEISEYLSKFQNNVKENCAGVVTAEEPSIIQSSSTVVDKSNDFKGFLENCCEIHPDFFTAKEELSRAFRIYSKTTIEKSTKDKFNTFLKNKFTSGVEFYENIRRNVWRGFRLRPLTFLVNNPDNIQDYEQFILDKCNVNYLNRISYVDFFETFTEYKKQHDQNYILTYPIKQKIQMYLTDNFANGRVHLSNQKKAKHLFGVLGLSLQNISGLKETNRTCKKVSKFDCQTNERINTWDSLTIAAKQLNIPRSSLSSFIKFQTIKDNSIFKYTE